MCKSNHNGDAIFSANQMQEKPIVAFVWVPRDLSLTLLVI